MFVLDLSYACTYFSLVYVQTTKKIFTLLSHPNMNTTTTLSKVIKWKGENVFRLEVVYNVCHLQYANIVFLPNKSSFCSYATIVKGSNYYVSLFKHICIIPILFTFMTIKVRVPQRLFKFQVVIVDRHTNILLYYHSTLVTVEALWAWESWHTLHLANHVVMHMCLLAINNSSFAPCFEPKKLMCAP